MSASVDELLTAYRKAVRTKDGVAAVMALRQLLVGDKSRDWTQDLETAERSLQRRLLDKFKEAYDAGRVEECEDVAQKLSDKAWRKPLAGREKDKVLGFLAAQKAKRNAAEGENRMTVLRKCHNEVWDRPSALAALKDIDRLVGMGWAIPQGDKEIADDCRRRCEKELKIEEFEKRWRSLCELLRGAVQRKDITAIRQVLSSPEFLDRAPDAELLKDAQLAVRNYENSKRRRTLVIAGLILFMLLAAIGMSGWWLKQKRFDERCVREAARLAALEKGPHPIERMGKVLRNLEVGSPTVFADSRVNVFAERLRTLVEKNVARTNEIVKVVSGLRTIQNGGWSATRDKVNEALDRVKSLLSDEDTVLASEWSKIKKSWEDHIAAEEAAFRSAGAEAGEKVIVAAHNLSERLATEICRANDDYGTKMCFSAIEAWRAKYAVNLLDINEKIAIAEKALDESLKVQKNLHQAIAKLNGSETAQDMIVARKSLASNYAKYAAVRNMKPSPADEDVVRDVLKGETAAQKVFASKFNEGVSGESFNTFVEDNVFVAADIPMLYSLYGLSRRNDRAGVLFAIAAGKPQKTDVRITGKLLYFKKEGMVDKLNATGYINSEIYDCRVDSIPSSDEMKEVIRIARQSDITAMQFELEVLKLIDRHLREGHTAGFVEKETQACTHFTRGQYPVSLRIQMLDIYFQWLDNGMKFMPYVPELLEWKQKVAALAAPISVSGVPDDLSWACLWDSRIRSRNIECARLLSRIPQTWTSTYKAIRSEMRELKALSRWRVETAGILRFDPLHPAYVKDPLVVLPHVFFTVSCDHPLYVLRMVNGEARLKRALSPCDGKWVRTGAMGRDYIPGEPLFHVIEDDAPIDPEERISALANTLKQPTVRRLLNGIPLFGISGGTNSQRRAISTDDASALVYAATELELTGKIDQAEDCYEKAVELGNRDACIKLGDLILTHRFEELKPTDSNDFFSGYNSWLKSAQNLLERASYLYGKARKAGYTPMQPADDRIGRCQERISRIQIKVNLAREAVRERIRKEELRRQREREEAERKRQEELRRQQEEAERQRQEELRRQQEDAERKHQEELRRQQEEAKRKRREEFERNKENPEYRIENNYNLTPETLSIVIREMRFRSDTGNEYVDRRETARHRGRFLGKSIILSGTILSVEDPALSHGVKLIVNVYGEKISALFDGMSPDEAITLRVGQKIDFEGTVSDRMHVSSLAMNNCHFVKLTSVED